METKKVSGKEKFGLALLTMGNIPIMTLINSFLLIFYTDVVGLNPAAVATLFIVARFFDAANDPVIGYILDHRKAKSGGKFRPVLMLFGPIAALNFLLLWFGGVWAPAAKLFVVYVIYLLFSITFTVLDISGNSVLAVMSDDVRQRDTLSIIKGICQIFGGAVVSIAAPIILASFGSGLQGYYVLIIAVSVVIAAGTFFGAKGVREHKTADVDAGKYRAKDLLGIFTFTPLLVVFLFYLAVGLGSSFQTSVNAYFFTYVMGDIKYMSTVSGAGMIGLIAAIILSKPLMNKGKKVIIAVSAATLTLGCLIRLPDTGNLMLQILGGIIFNFGTGLFTSTIPALLADNVDALERERGFRAEGAVFSLSSFISKVSMGIGGAVPGYVLAAVGYQQNAAAQSAPVNQAIVWMLLVLPAIFYIVSGIFFMAVYRKREN